MSEEIESHVLERYEIHKKLGRGAYGIVWKAIDKRNKRTVALKKVFEAFQNSVDAQRTYREVMYLQELNGHDNIVRLLSIIRAHNNRDLYLVFEYMETDLHTVIKHNILQGIHKQFIFYQLLKALKYIHTGDLIHRDLKPSNLLINSECLIKVADFGLARSVAQKDDGQDPVVSDYVATRWYRAPEILLGSQCYNKAVDMWSAGCILAELIAGKVLFTGKSTLNQVELIIELLGRPKDSQIDALGSHVARNILANITAQKTRSFTQLFSSEGKDALDLLRRLLTFSPNERMTVEEALEHPYVRTWHCLQDEISCPKIIKLPVDDNIKLSLKEYRDAIYKDITEKSKQTKKAPQDNLPKINDKIKSVAASKEKNPEPEPSTTLGDKRSISGAVTQSKDEPQVRPRRTLEPSTQATEKVRQNKSFEWNQTGASPTSSVLNNKVSNSFGVLQVSPSPSASKIQLENSLKSNTSTAQLVRGPTASGLAPAGTAHPLRVGSKQNYKSLDVSLENQHPGAAHLHDEGYGVGGKWLRSVSPGGHGIQPSNPGLKSNKRLPSRQEDSNQSQSKGNFKVSQSSVQNDSLSGVNNSSKLKRSGYLLGSGTSLGAHKKSASLVQPYKSPTNNSKKEDPVVLTKKSSANYFFKKPKTKTEIVDMDRIGQKQLLSVVSQPQKTFGFNGIGNHKLGA